MTDKCHGACRHGTAERPEHRPVVLRLRGRNRSVGISHDGCRDHAAFQDHVRLYGEKGRIRYGEMSKLSDFNRTDIGGDALSYHGVDRVCGAAWPGSEIICLALLLGQSPKLFFHFVSSLPRTNDHFAYAANCLPVGRHNRQSAKIMEDVLGRYRFPADAALGEGDIFGNSGIEVMSHHHHIEGLFERVHGVGPRRSCRRWDDIRLTAHLDDVRGVAATGSFGVKGVNSSSLEGCDRILDKAAFVQCVSVDKNLHIHVIRDGEAAINGGGGRTPVFVKLEAACPGLDLLDETSCRARVALTEKTEIHGKSIGSLQHPLDMPRSWRAGRGSRPGGGTCSTAHNCREA